MARVENGIDRRLLSDVETLRREYGDYVDAVVRRAVAGGVELDRIALDVFNTPVAADFSIDTAICRIIANPLNAIGPLIHAAGPVEGRPVYLVHGADGEVGWFLRHMRPAVLPRPVYGVTAPGWYGDPMPVTVDGLAGRLVERIRSHQPTGPYTLGGYSAGAFIALAMARALEAGGDRVDRLFLLDPVFGEERLELSDIIAFRLAQLRKRRHPVMAPFFELADETSVAAVLDRLARPDLPSEPIARRFYRGLLVLWGVLGAVPTPAGPAIRATGTIILAEESVRLSEGDVVALAARARPHFATDLDVVALPVPHVRLFEDTSFHEVFADRL